MNYQLAEDMGRLNFRRPTDQENAMLAALFGSVRPQLVDDMYLSLTDAENPYSYVTAQKFSNNPRKKKA